VSRETGESKGGLREWEGKAESSHIDASAAYEESKKGMRPKNERGERFSTSA